jgi:serine/threonine-protein kinase RsbW
VLLEALERKLVEHGIPATMRGELRLIAEEVACNAAEHGATGIDAEAGQTISVEILRREARVHVEFRDTGCAFDPLAHPCPALEDDILDRPIGGLGVHLVRELAEKVSYAREGRHNVLRVVLVIPDPPSEHPP